MTEIHRINPETRYSDATVHNGTVYLAGQVPETLTGSATVQTQEVLAAIDQVLAAAGSDKSKLLTATVYLAHMADYAEMNAVWDAWLPPGCAPARACVEARMAKPEYRVEIQVIAAL
ncbi:RidA family protein [Elstera cyanobacteriorum]|uniref:RidA family protein n=1 Tax=Elstera cyanobacteriorum TaxID=2022747 RepID=UPI002353F80C|nr:RidA family protein [Elstera cyanobacteriorum]MCK6441479.1 RidA family protein [Elstera cyanobacteriorum]